MKALRELQACFEGAIPATIVTVDESGVPNAVNMSQVWLVDDKHVALSRQFSKRTAKNLKHNPRASLLLPDPTQYQHYKLALRYVRSETSGTVFDAISAKIDAIAAMSGMSDVFKLAAADIFVVDDVEPVVDCVYNERL